MNLTQESRDLVSKHWGASNMAEKIEALARRYAESPAELLREVVEAFQGDDVHRGWFESDRNDPVEWQRVSRALTAAREWVEKNKAVPPSDPNDSDRVDAFKVANAVRPAPIPDTDEAPLETGDVELLTMDELALGLGLDGKFAQRVHDAIRMRLSRRAQSRSAPQAMREAIQPTYPPTHDSTDADVIAELERMAELERRHGCATTETTLRIAARRLTRALAPTPERSTAREWPPSDEWIGMLVGRWHSIEFQGTPGKTMRRALEEVGPPPHGERSARGVTPIKLPAQTMGDGTNAGRSSVFARGWNGYHSELLKLNPGLVATDECIDTSREYHHFEGADPADHVCAPVNPGGVTPTFEDVERAYDNAKEWDGRSWSRDVGLRAVMSLYASSPKCSSAPMEFVAAAFKLRDHLHSLSYSDCSGPSRAMLQADITRFDALASVDAQAPYVAQRDDTPYPASIGGMAPSSVGEERVREIATSATLHALEFNASAKAAVRDIVHKLASDFELTSMAFRDKLLGPLDARVRAVEGETCNLCNGAGNIGLESCALCRGRGRFYPFKPTPPEPKDEKCAFCHDLRDAGSVIEVRFGLGGKVFCKACDRLLGTSAAVEGREAKCDKCKHPMVNHDAHGELDEGCNVLDVGVGHCGCTRTRPASSASEGVPSWVPSGLELQSVFLTDNNLTGHCFTWNRVRALIAQRAKDGQRG